MANNIGHCLACLATKVFLDKLMPVIKLWVLCVSDSYYSATKTLYCVITLIDLNDGMDEADSAH